MPLSNKQQIERFHRQAAARRHIMSQIKKELPDPNQICDYCNIREADRITLDDQFICYQCMVDLYRSSI